MHFGKFLALSICFFLVVVVGCAHRGAAFDGVWDFCEKDGKVRACLSEPDVKKLKAILNKCEVK